MVRWVTGRDHRRLPSVVRRIQLIRFKIENDLLLRHFYL